MLLITSVEVERLPLGYATFARCVAREAADGTLVVSSIDDQTPLHSFLAGTWRCADVRDEHGTVIDRFSARVPHHDLSAHLFATGIALAKVQGGRL